MIWSNLNKDFFISQCLEIYFDKEDLRPPVHKELVMTDNPCTIFNHKPYQQIDVLYIVHFFVGWAVKNNKTGQVS